MMNILAWTGYWVGLGIELFVIVVAGTLLVLMLTGVFEILLAKIKELIVKIGEWIKQKKEESAKKKAEKKALAEAEAAAKAEAQADAEVAMTEEGEGETSAEGENAEGEKTEGETAEEDGKGKKKKKKKSKKDKEEEELLAEVASEEATASEETAEGENAEGEKTEAEPEEDEGKGKKKKKKGKKAEEEEEEAVAEDGAEGGDGDTETIIVQEGVVFGETKTITELYEELSAEQKGYFDELREAALAKPDAELAMSKNFVAVKIGKRNLIKLLIKRGVTVAEFLIENEAAKQLRLSSTNKRGKSAIKVKPTVVQVLDVPSLQVAIDMINLSYEEIMLAD